MTSFFNKFKIYLCLILLILLLTSYVEASKGSKRETETMTLENGLDVLLISDPDVHRSTAALSVGIGYLYDPVEKQGLAHYLEHMLFLGTKKYPEVGSYQKYLKEHSGTSNAYTSGSITNYFFQVSHDGFREALDRFSDFFKAPLFDKTYAEREVNAVNNEHEKNKRSDGWRGRFIQKLISKPGHPLTKFGTGNLDTLKGDNSSALTNIYRKFYTASNMKLAMLSNMPLDSMANIAQEFFHIIPNHKVEHPEIPSDFRMPLNNKYRLLKIKTIKDLKTLEIDFPTIRLIDHKESKPASIVGDILGYEGKGSLLSKLKDEGLVLGLSAGGGSVHHNLNSFTINISLTTKGLNEYEKILKFVFAYINAIKENGIQEYTFKQNQAMAQINFDWKSPDEGMMFIAGKASKMHDFNLEEIETLPYLITKYEPEAYKAILDTLTPENALITISSNTVETDKVTPYYDAEYSISHIGDKAFNDLKNPPKSVDMFYPDENKFIPYNLTLIDEIPHLIRDDSLGRIWFKFDTRFKQPKVYLSLRIETPAVYDTARNHLLSKLYEAAVREGLNELVYPLQMAGLSYSLSTNDEGVVLTIGGYSERIDDLMKLVTKNLTEIRIDEQKFNNIKESMIRELENLKLGKAYYRGGYYNSLMWFQKQFSEEEKLAALTSLTLNDLKEYPKKLYEKIYMTGMGHGNWSDEKVKESTDLLFNALKSKPLPEDQRFKQVVEVLNTGERYRFSREVMDNNNSLAYAIQVGEKELPLQARTSMVASIIETDFYTQMRTNQQLGYIVWSFNQVTENRVFIRLIIQSSTHGAFEMSNRVNNWLLTTEKLFDNLTEEEFERHRQGLIISLEKEPDSIGGALSELYRLATKEEGDFRYKKKMILAVKNLTKEDVVQEGKKIFINSETPRIEVLMRAKDNTEPVPDGVLTEIVQFKDLRKQKIN